MEKKGRRGDGLILVFLLIYNKGLNIYFEKTMRENIFARKLEASEETEGEETEENKIPFEKSRKEVPPACPYERFLVPDGKVSWDEEFPDYDPPDYTSLEVLDNDKTKKEGGWADPENIEEVDHPFKSYMGEVKFDKEGKPLNPMGRTGLKGRILGNWGANFTADLFVTRLTEKGKIQGCFIKRSSGEWAMPGGFLNPGEKGTDGAGREFTEETSEELDLEKAVKIYEGYVDDLRNTDNAWIETNAYHMHLGLKEGRKINPKGADDAKKAKWKNLSRKKFKRLYASHSFIIKRGLVDFYNREKENLPGQAKKQLEKILEREKGEKA